MAEKQMLLDIVSAEAEIFSGQVSFISVTGSQGELGIAPGHTALITPIKPGQLTATLPDGSELVFYISGGVLEVQPTQVMVLSDTASRAEDLDEAAVMAAKEAAEKMLSDQKAEIEYSQALSELAEASAQLRAIQTLRERKGRG
jgi:F-type H+-transporting ATPase subunit epsilon